jgi:subtilisin family serine protease
MANGRLDVRSSAAQAYVAQLEAEQAAFVSQMQAALPSVSVASYINESGQSIQATYQVVLNGVAVDPSNTNLRQAMKTLSQLSDVKAVYHDYAHQPDLYESRELINVAALWDQAGIGGMGSAGAGVKVASIDGGLHHDAAMFSGDGYDYPEGWPDGGLGDSSNNNGKIIASRAYFRDWDPPAAGDENAWPGENGTSHGTHTGSTAAGNVVTATYGGADVGEISGVAPAAWVMSYRVFYASVSNDGSFYTVEGIAALEDIVMDGADVVNNSWGSGPGSAGGEFDAVDTALINAVNAGVFVSMSAGNAGPNNGTSDHPSDEYIIVAASTTSGTYASGLVNMTAPAPVPDELQGINLATSSFGAPLPIGEVNSYTYVTAASIGDGSNFEGCNAWPAGTFDGVAAVISRGACEFGLKVLNAEQAGAEFVVVHNHASGGDTLVGMSGGAVGNQVTISSIFVGNTAGLAIVAWYDQAVANGDEAQFEVDTFAFQAGNSADQIASFSSRGPGVGQVLKPDIAAPGVNIMAQGYTPGASGEARHLGYGQVSGTSMASPHVAGAAALMRQLYPDWSNADIKSALMSTSKYMDIYNFDGTPAQPLDMGAGRLDLTNAADPGVILSPPSVSFGTVPSNTSATVEVMVTNVASDTETYSLSTLYTGDSFTMTSDLAGFTITPDSVTLAAGESAMVTVEFDAAMSMALGDNQGYIIMAGDNGHDAHMAAWARVLPPMADADVLIIDADASPFFGFVDHLDYYTETLETLGMSYETLDWATQAIPDAANLSAYKYIILFSGDNWRFGLSNAQMNRLTEYANMGGIVIVMGQDMSRLLNDSFFDNSVLGDEQLQDDVTGSFSPEQQVVPHTSAPAALNGVSLDLSLPSSTSLDLTAAAEVPPPVVPTGASGSATLSYNGLDNELTYALTVVAGDPITITAAHIHTGTVGNNGPPLHALFAGPQYITDSLSFGGVVTLSDAEEAALLDGGLYINVHSTVNGPGEVRGQIVGIDVSGDGAGNQFFIDEIASEPNYEPVEVNPYAYNPLFVYPGTNNMDEGVVGMAHRANPTLEHPGISYHGRSIYTSFGLEGVNDSPGSTSRAELLGTLMDWAMDEPEVTLDSGQLASTMYLTATVSSDIDGTTGVSYRWDFGDDSDYAGPFTSNIAGYDYEECGTYTVRVEATDSWGNRAIGSTDVTVSEDCTTPTAVDLNQLKSNGSGSTLPLALVGALALLAGMTFLIKRRKQQ